MIGYGDNRKGREPVERRTPQGLEAFEGAPCYREVVEREPEDLES